jgi:AcrR family transcriptional regulator
MPRRTPELRDRLLDVAIATLSEEGIARFTTRRVAERAGTSVPAVYELFDDKAGLVRAMFFEFLLLCSELPRCRRPTIRSPMWSGSFRSSGSSAAPIRGWRR